MTETPTADVLAQIRADLLNPRLHLISGVGDADTPGKGEAGTIAEIMLRLTGVLSDGPHPCISEVIRRWVIRIQDAMPDSVRNSVAWRSASGGIAGSATTMEAEIARRDLIMGWMWDRLGDEAVLAAVPESARLAWDQMLAERTSDSAQNARKACGAAYAAYAVAYAAYAADDAAYAADDADVVAYVVAYAAYAAAYADDDAYVADVAADDGGGVARTAFWVRADPAGLLVALIEVR